MNTFQVPGGSGGGGQATARWCFTRRIKHVNHSTPESSVSLMSVLCFQVVTMVNGLFIDFFRGTTAFWMRLTAETARS